MFFVKLMRHYGISKKIINLKIKTTYKDIQYRFLVWGKLKDMLQIRLAVCQGADLFL